MRGTNEELAKALKAKGFTPRQIALVAEAIDEVKKVMFPCFDMPKAVRIRYGIPSSTEDVEGV